MAWRQSMHEGVWVWTHRLADHNPDPPTAQPSRVTVTGRRSVLSANGSGCTSQLMSSHNLVLDVQLFSQQDTDPAAAFLNHLTKNMTFPRPCSLSMILSNRLPFPTKPQRSPRLYRRKPHQKRFKTLKLWSDRFSTNWAVSPASSRY